MKVNVEESHHLYHISQYRGVIYNIYHRSTSTKVSGEESFITYPIGVHIQKSVERSHL